jgi:glycerate-2-kinase
MKTNEARRLLRNLFDAAITAAQPAHCVPLHLPEAPRGRLIVIGAGKASAAMARALEENWPGELSGLVVTRYGYAFPASASRSSRPPTRYRTPPESPQRSASTPWCRDSAPTIPCCA